MDSKIQRLTQSERKARRKARILAVQFLYQKSKLPRSEFESFLTAGDLSAFPPAVLNFVEQICQTTLDSLSEIDALISDCLLPPRGTQNAKKKWQMVSKEMRGWKQDRLSPTLNAVLRAGVAELMRFPSIPSTVVISEMLSICSQYVGKEQTDLCNAILDKISKKIRVSSPRSEMALNDIKKRKETRDNF